MLTRRSIALAVAGVAFLLLVVGLHFFVERQIQVAAAPAPTVVAPTAVPTVQPTPPPTVAPPTAVPTVVPTRPPATATRPPLPSNTPAPTNTPAPPPTFTPTPGPIVTNDKLGVGVYTSAIPFNVLRTLRPAMLLLQDPDPRTAQQLRPIFPKALIIGRHFVTQSDDALMAHCDRPTEDHMAQGVAFANYISNTALALKGTVDAWVSDNEQSESAKADQLACHAQFQTGFIETMQGKYGIDAVAGNDAAGAVEPADYPKYFAKPISEAKYFGIHAYGKPESRTLQNGADSIYYALRYRLIHDELVKAGVKLPSGGFVLTETGVYEGWRGLVPDQKMSQDFEWLEQQTAQDSYVKGQFIFGLDTQGRFGIYEIQGTALLEMLGQYNAQHAGTP
ncbi:MAG: hypothetical protein JO247_13325 [Chloroflexi bacterium]|nr:hypothetical protein [Chloroflexota bacterium]